MHDIACVFNGHQQASSEPCFSVLHDIRSEQKRRNIIKQDDEDP